MLLLSDGKLGSAMLAAIGRADLNVSLICNDHNFREDEEGVRIEFVLVTNSFPSPFDCDDIFSKSICPPLISLLLWSDVAISIAQIV